MFLIAFRGLICGMLLRSSRPILPCSVRCILTPPVGLSEHLLAVVADAVIAGNWMQSKDGQKNRNRPKPIPRPGVKPESKKFGGQAEDIDTIRAWLGW